MEDFPAINLSFLEVGIPMVKNKNVVGRRILSILLCMMMVLCTVPMIAFAAADGAGITVLERSNPLLYVYRNIAEVRQPETVKTGTPLSSYPLVTTGAVLRTAKESGAWDTSYSASVLKAEWVNPDKVFDEAGTYTEPVYIYHNTDDSIWVKVEYTFTVEQGSSVAPAEIITMPTIESPVKYTENMKVSALKLSGGEANVPGEFSFTEPDKTLYVAENIPVSITFTPADPTQAEAVTFTIPVTVEKGDIVVTEAPTFTFVYENTPLKNRSVLHNAVIEGGVIEPSAVTWDFYDETGLKVKDPQANLALGVGNYQVVARAMAQDSRNFNIGFCTVNVVIKADETKAFPLQADLEGNELRIKANGSYTGKGTVTYSVNDTVVAQNADPKAEVVYAIPESGDYTVKAEYTPAEHDNYIYKPATQTVKVILPHTVTVNGGSGSGSYKPSQTVRVEFDQTSLKKYYEFKGWKITNAEGETVDVGVSDLTQTSISFTMPDEDVTVEATSSFSIQLFFKNVGSVIMSFLMKVVEWIMGLFNGLGSLS